MPKNASMEQRIEWHLAHQQHCACRGIPAGVLRAIETRGLPREAGSAGRRGKA